MNKDTEKQKSLGLLGYLYREAYHCNGCVSIKYSCEFCDEKNEIECNNAHSILSNLIEDYYKSKENHIALSKAFDELYDLIYRPKPYKFEDLKPNMWVWDEKNNECIFITNVDIKDKTICCVFSYDSDIEQFEENRFYPLTKAMQYQEVKDD